MWGQKWQCSRRVTNGTRMLAYAFFDVLMNRMAVVRKMAGCPCVCTGRKGTVGGNGDGVEAGGGTHLANEKCPHPPAAVTALAVWGHVLRSCQTCRSCAAAPQLPSSKCLRKLSLWFSSRRLFCVVCILFAKCVCIIQVFTGANVLYVIMLSTINIKNLCIKHKLESLYLQS